MRIISSFKDYYDISSSHGIDLTRIYNRTTKNDRSLKIPIPSWEKKRGFTFSKTVEKYPKFFYRVCFNKASQVTYEMQYIYVLFAGKLYGGLSLVENTAAKVERKYIWSVKELDNFLEETDIFNIKACVYSSRSTHYLGSKNSIYAEAKQVLSIKGDPILLDWAIKNKITILVIEQVNNTLEEITQITHDLPLKDIAFQKVLDPFTAYQELDQWLGGVLGNTEVIPEMSDKDKVVSHGFGPWSFRKHKLDNKD